MAQHPLRVAIDQVLQDDNRTQIEKHRRVQVLQVNAQRQIRLLQSLIVCPHVRHVDVSRLRDEVVQVESYAATMLALLEQQIERMSGAGPRRRAAPRAA